MTTEEAHQSAPQGTRPGRLPRPEHAVDVLAKGLAGEGLSRGQALRMVGAALAGAALAVFVPGVARAQQDGPVDHGTQGAVDGKANATCPFKKGNRDADCPSGCPCSFWTSGGAAYFICGTQGRGREQAQGG